MQRRQIGIKNKAGNLGFANERGIPFLIPAFGLPHGERSWRLYIQDMIEFGEKVLSYTDGLDQEAFIAETLVYDATLRNLELIGEAATHIPAEVREAHSL